MQMVSEMKGGINNQAHRKDLPKCKEDKEERMQNKDVDKNQFDTG